MKEIKIETDYIKLDQFLKFAGACQTGGEAKWMIEEGLVLLNGEQVMQRGKKCYPGDKIELLTDPPFKGKII